MKLKSCPICESKKIHEETGRVVRRFHGKKMMIPNITYWVCLRCKEKIFPATAIRKMDEFLRKKAA